MTVCLAEGLRPIRCWASRSLGNSKAARHPVHRCFNAPPIPGLGSTGGFQYQIEDINDKGPDALFEITQEFIAKANALPEIGQAFSDFEID